MRRRFEELAGATGLEPAASCVTGRRSNQLNYAPAWDKVLTLLLCLLMSPGSLSRSRNLHPTSQSESRARGTRFRRIIWAESTQQDHAVAHVSRFSARPAVSYIEGSTRSRHTGNVESEKGLKTSRTSASDVSSFSSQSKL